MSNKIKLYTQFGKTILNCEKIKSIQELIPSFNDIIGHLNSFSGKEKEYIPILTEVSEEKLIEINREIRKLTCVNNGYNTIFVYLESYSSSKFIPVLKIIEKKEDGQK